MDRITATATAAGGSSSTTRDLLLLLAGALFALAAQALVQLVIVPRVDARKRREDRWERHVLELGELLTADVPEAAQELEAQGRGRLTLNRAKDLAHVDRQRWETAFAEHQTQMQEASARYSSLASTRVEWLVRRALSLGADTMPGLEVGWMRYQGSQLLADITSHVPDDGDELRQVWKDERDSRDNLLREVEGLAESGPPRRNVLRIRRARRHVRRWLSGRRHDLWVTMTPAGRRFREADRLEEQARAAAIADPNDGSGPRQPSASSDPGSTDNAS